MNFNLCEPITWSDIISASASLFTLVAVIVAICANINSSRQLKKALQMHEQGKNIDLLDKRLEWVKRIQEDAVEDDLAFSVLFSQDLEKHYHKLKQLKNQIDNYESDLNTYEYLICEAAEAAGRDSALDRIKKAQGLACLYDGCDEEEDKEREFRELCYQNEVFSSYNSPDGKQRKYNYYEITAAISQATIERNECRENLVKDMMGFIKDSIKPLMKEKEKP